MNRIAPLALVALLSACGKVADLEPQTGHSLPQKPALAKEALDSNELLTLPPYAKPERVDELLKKGESRKPDRFDLPPPNGKSSPAPTQNDSSGASTTGPDNEDETNR